MAHRNGFPKPSASERTIRRYRIRHNIKTTMDKIHIEFVDRVKEPIRKLQGKIDELKIK